ncbi:MAG: hypothetical protein LUQ04_05430 [Methanoregula sp.]|nr:hypothetical protein [Methanoregula sp.]
MKYLLFIVLLVAVVACTGCAGSGDDYTGSANDNAYVKFLGSGHLAEDLTKFRDDLKFNQYQVARIDAQEIVRDYENSPIPDNSDLRQARSLYIAGYTQIAQGDIEGGIATMTPGKALTDNWVNSHKR